MAGWLSKTDIARSDKLYNDMLNSLALDDRNWGGDVNGGGHHLSNVILDGSGGFAYTLSPISLTQGADGESRMELRSGSGATSLLRWALVKDATAESGANAGSNFNLNRYNDAGTLLGTPFSINRATGVITMGAQSWTGPINGGGQTISNITIAGTVTDPTTTKGDLLVRSASAVTRLGVGTDGQVLTADSSSPTLGMKWAAQAGGVPTTRQVIAGTGLSGGGALSADVTLSVVNDTTTQRLEAALAGTLVAARKQVNFINGSGTSINVADNAGSNRVDVTISLTGTGPASPSIYAVNGNVIGTRPQLNLIAGSNTTISGVDNSGANRVDVTISSTGGGGSQTPWATDIDGNSKTLFNAGKIGVGIPAPLYLLDVGGGDSQVRIGTWGGVSADAAGGFTAGENIYRDSTGTFRALSTHGSLGGGGMCVASADIRFVNYTGGATQGAVVPAAERMRITAAGNVGIGTSTPLAAFLTVVTTLPKSSTTTGNATNALFLATNDAANPFSLRFQIQGAAALANRAAILQTTDFNAADGGNILMQPTGGNVGIGTTAPAYKLDVPAGAIHSDWLYIKSQPKSASTLAGISLDSTDATASLGAAFTLYGGGSPRLAIQVVEQTIAFRPITLNESGSGFVAIGSTTASSPLDIRVPSSSGATAMLTILGNGASNAGDSVRIRMGPSSGFTASPQLAPYMEAINENASQGAGLAFGTYNSALAERMRITATGAVLLNNGTAITARPSGDAARFAGELAGIGGVSYADAGYLRLSAGGGTGPAQKTFIDLSGYSPTPDLDATISFGIRSVEKMRLSPVGLNLIGGQYFVNGVPIGAGGVAVQINSSAYGTFSTINFFASTGMAITNGGIAGSTISVQFSAPSDLRLKRDVQPLEGGLPLVLQLRPVSAEWNGLAGTREGERFTGIIAQELQKIIPNAVNPYRTKLREEDESPTELLAYDQMAITSHLILAIQQLEQRLRAIESKTN